MGPYHLNGPRSAPVQAYPSNEVDADDEREPRQSHESKKDRKWKSKAKEGPFYDIYHVISPSIQQQKYSIVPGATPNQRYIPPGEPIAPPLLTPQPRWYGELDNADPYLLLSNWVSEYAAGYGKGYQVATNNRNGPSNGNHVPYLGPHRPWMAPQDAAYGSLLLQTVSVWCFLIALSIHMMLPLVLVKAWWK